jgi:hypothetical protein
VALCQQAGVYTLEEDVDLAHVRRHFGIVGSLFLF